MGRIWYGIPISCYLLPLFVPLLNVRSIDESFLDKRDMISEKLVSKYFSNPHENLQKYHIHRIARRFHREVLQYAQQLFAIRDQHALDDFSMNFSSSRIRGITYLKRDERRGEKLALLCYLFPGLLLTDSQSWDILPEAVDSHKKSFRNLSHFFH